MLDPELRQELTEFLKFNPLQTDVTPLLKETLHSYQKNATDGNKLCLDTAPADSIVVDSSLLEIPNENDNNDKVKEVHPEVSLILSQEDSSTNNANNSTEFEDDDDGDYIPESEGDERDKLHRKKKSRKNHPCPEEWVGNKTQKRREQGLAYEGLVRNEGKWKYTAPREKRKKFSKM